MVRPGRSDHKKIGKFFSEIADLKIHIDLRK